MNEDLKVKYDLFENMLIEQMNLLKDIVQDERDRIDRNDETLSGSG